MLLKLDYYGGGLKSMQPFHASGQLAAAAEKRMQWTQKRTYLVQNEVTWSTVLVNKDLIYVLCLFGVYPARFLVRFRSRYFDP